jgi:hypothetical protein
LARFRPIEDAAKTAWGNPGDKVTVVINLLNRERALNMELKEFQKDTRVTYVSCQQGLPDAQHERHFMAVPAGCAYRLVVAYEPRQGLAGLFDRYFVKGSVERAMRKLGHNLGTVFQQQSARA